MGRRALRAEAAVALAGGLALGLALARPLRRACDWLRHRLRPAAPLQLQRPLVTLDTETTGVNVSRDRVVEIAAIKLMPDGTVLTKGPQRLNPGMPIPGEATAIHGINDADVADCPTFEAVAAEWREWLDGCDLHGYNALKFDVPLLRSEFARANLGNFPPPDVPVVDSMQLFFQHEPRNLAGAVRFYCGRDHAGDAHSAMGDARAALAVLQQQVRRYRLPRSVAELADATQPHRADNVTSDGRFRFHHDAPVFCFGKFAGHALATVALAEPDYLYWMLRTDFSDEVKHVVRRALQGWLPTRRQGGWTQIVQPAVMAE